jgi:hypothetical protein
MNMSRIYEALKKAGELRAVASELQLQPASVRNGEGDMANFSSVPLVHANLNAVSPPYHASNNVCAVAWIQY